MEENLSKLHAYLLSNGYVRDASRVGAILNELSQHGRLSSLSRERLSAMCSPRYLGDLYIREFPSPYAWWNLLAEIKGSLGSDKTLGTDTAVPQHWSDDAAATLRSRCNNREDQSDGGLA